MELNELNLENIEIESWETISEKYNVFEDDVDANLGKGKRSCDNFWTVSEESDFSDEEVEVVKNLFALKFPDVEIKHPDVPRLTEIYLDRLEKHQFMYSLISVLKNINSEINK